LYSTSLTAILISCANKCTYYIYIQLYIYDIKVPSLWHVSACQCYLQSVYTKLKTICSKMDYVYEIVTLYVPCS
jgi:hypothetical protein